MLQKDGSVVWHGEVPETGERATLMLWSNALLTGHFVFNGKIFTVESLGGGVTAFAEMDRRRLPADHPEPGARRDSVPTASPPAAAKERPALRPAPAEPAVAPFAHLERQAQEAKNITIDVMVLYTANAAKRYVREPADLLLAIEEANATFRNSGIGNVSLRLVHTQMIECDETEDDQFTHLYTMVDGLGPFGNARELRDEKHADIVGLIIDNPTGCGLSTASARPRMRHSSSYTMPARQPPCRFPTRSDIFSEPGMIVSWTRTTRRSPMGMATSTAANGATS